MVDCERSSEERLQEEPGEPGAGEGEGRMRARSELDRLQVTQSSFSEFQSRIFLIKNLKFNRTRPLFTTE